MRINSEIIFLFELKLFFRHFFIISYFTNIKLCDLVRIFENLRVVLYTLYLYIYGIINQSSFTLIYNFT